MRGRGVTINCINSDWSLSQVSVNNHKSNATAGATIYHLREIDTTGEQMMSTQSQQRQFGVQGTIPFCNRMAIGDWRRRRTQFGRSDLDGRSIRTTRSVHSKGSRKRQSCSSEENGSRNSDKQARWWSWSCGDDERRVRLLIVYFQIRAPNPFVSGQSGAGCVRSYHGNINTPCSKRHA